jgi:hypothetical protein
LKVTVLVPCAAPKPLPPMVTELLTEPAVGERLVMLGGGNTVNVTPALETPDTVTTTFPVVAPDGTGTTMLVFAQLVGVPGVPLKVIVLVPWVVPKLVPDAVIAAPTAPDPGVRDVILGTGNTVKLTPLLFTPLANTTTFPVVAPVGTVTAMLVALQLVTLPAVPLKLTVLDPCVAPKFVPVIVTAAPVAPEVVERLVILGADTTVKLTPLLFTPLANTTTFPVVAPVGTVTAMLVALQLVTLAAVPLNFTVPLP